MFIEIVPEVEQLRTTETESYSAKKIQFSRENNRSLNLMYTLRAKNLSNELSVLLWLIFKAENLKFTIKVHGSWLWCWLIDLE